jgi:GGDEF domain-containing protein
MRILKERRGSMYDPLVVDMFMRVYKDITPREPAQTVRRQVLKTIAESASIVAPSAGSGLDEISASTEEMLALYGMASALAGQVNLSDAADIIAKHLRRLIPASLCVFYRYDAASDDLKVAHALGDGASLVEGTSIRTGERLSGWVAANRQTILNSDPILDFGETARAMKPRLRSCLSTALIRDGQLVGVLSLYSPVPRAFTDDHRRIIEAVSGRVSQTFYHSLDYEKTRVQRLKDPVTGLPNLEYFNRLLDENLLSALPTPFSILFIEASPGDYEGDAVRWSLELAPALSHSFRAALRGADLLFRYSENQFVVVLPQTESSVSVAIAARLREKAAFRLSEGAGRLWLRIVSASAPEDALSISDLMVVAQSRLRIHPADRIEISGHHQIH